ncbi:hypothetical protein ELG63_36510 [Rhizobium leguminosarum]|uniref:hypothetical protein n=1 Tax=Rhizobium leguminosarum TaxID=384 RepID=UPI0010307C50|nr:hypothetical protein [Rhizobium leguminosarum]TBH28193.1 hypothetical protein ELG63_36510 [Rhizobium leguminosarum]
MSTKMACERWAYFEEVGCVKMDARTSIPIPGADGQPQLRKFPLPLRVKQMIGSNYGGVAIETSPNDSSVHESVIASLMHHADRIAPFAEYYVAPEIMVFDIAGNEVIDDGGTAEIYEILDTGSFYRTRAALFTAGRDPADTRERFWKALFSTVTKEKTYLDEAYQNALVLWSDVGTSMDGCYTYAGQLLTEGSPSLEIALKRGELKWEHIPRLRTEYKTGSWATFSYLWSVYADRASETIDRGEKFAAPDPQAPDHTWLFYRVFFGVEGEAIERVHPGNWYEIDQMDAKRANYLSPTDTPKVAVKPMAVQPVRKAG